ncbi:hypothetical protein Sste5344_006285 [Sporothrix stenoceras]
MTASQDGKLQEKFHMFSLCTLAVLLSGVWQTAAGSLVTGIYGGGPPVAIFGTLGFGVALSIECLALAEFASSYPSAGGLTYAAFKVGGPKYGRITSYLTGFYQSMGVLFNPASNILAITEVIVTCAELFYDDYRSTRWQCFLVYQFINIVIMGSVARGPEQVANYKENKPLTVFVSTGGIFVVGFAITVGVLVGKSPAIQSPDVVFGTLVNDTGFPMSIGIMIGFLGPLYAYGPSHWLLNMAEDVYNPTRNIPIAFLAQQIGNILFLFGFYVAAYFACPDFGALTESTYTTIIAGLYKITTQSAGLSLFLLLFVLFSYIFGALELISANIRLVYGFTRCESVPWVHWWAKVDEKYDLPINVTYVIAVVNALLGFIYLGSASAFNIFLGTCMAFYTIGFLPIFITAIMTNRKYITPGWFSLNWGVGMFTNAFSLAFQLFGLVIYTFPPSYPVTPATMNWAVVFVAAFTFVAALSWYYHGRHHYFTIDENEGVLEGSNDGIAADRLNGNSETLHYSAVESKLAGVMVSV